jgi:ParB family chromosome partitioning protein
VARAQASGLNLTQLAVAAEFAAEDGVVSELLAAAEDGPFAFDRTAEEARSAREIRIRCDQRRAELQGAGVVVLAERPTYNDPKAEEITYLRGPDGSPITAQAHATCPGHAVHLTGQRWNSSVAETAYCTDWRAHGHTTAAASGAPRRGPMSDAEKQERRQVIANNSAMDAANTVRRKYIAGLLAATTPPKGADRFIAEMLANGGHVLAIWISGGRPMLNELLSPGKKRAGTATVPARASGGRYTVISLACVAAALESQITRTSWRRPDRLTAAWLEFLTANGFQPGAVEQLITNAKAGKPSTHTPTEAKAVEPDDDTASLPAA